MCALTMSKISENDGAEEIGLVTPIPRSMMIADGYGIWRQGLTLAVSLQRHMVFLAVFGAED